MNQSRPDAAPSGPLAGLRILDLTTVLLGPYATKLLADLGADVVKIEAVAGESRRNYGPTRHPGMASQFMNVNRSKRTLAVNLKDPAGRDAFLRLAATADAVVHNARPQAMKRLGLDYQAVRAVRPEVVYCYAVGFGSGGRYAGRPAYDDVIQGLSGLPALLGRVCGSPQFVPVNVADRVCGVYLANAVLAALMHRVRHGKGQEVEVPMFETMAEFVLSEHLWGNNYEPALDWPSEIRLFDRRPLATRDGHICIMVSSDAHWQRLCDVIERPELKSDARYEKRAGRQRRVKEIYALLEASLAGRTSAAWLSLLEQADIPAAPMHTMESLLRDPHLDDVGFFQLEEHPTEGRLRTMRPPARYSGTPAHNPRHAPHLGEHSVEVLREAGLCDDEISVLVENGVVIDGRPTASDAATRSAS